MSEPDVPEIRPNRLLRAKTGNRWLANYVYFTAGWGQRWTLSWPDRPAWARTTGRPARPSLRVTEEYPQGGDQGDTGYTSALYPDGRRSDLIEARRATTLERRALPVGPWACARRSELLGTIPTPSACRP